MGKLRLTMACWNYDRTRALLEERIAVDGIELTPMNLPVEETFFRMLRHREFDVAELSLSSYTVSLFRENPPFIAIPVFPVALFPALLHLRSRGKRDSRAERPDRQAHRKSRVSNDCAGMDSRHHERRIRRARHQSHLLKRGRRRAGASGEDRAFAAAGIQAAGHPFG